MSLSTMSHGQPNPQWVLSFPHLEAGGILLAEDIQLVLKPGRLTLIKGPNGAGKSTLLRRLRERLAPEALFYKPPFGLRDELSVVQQARLFASLMGSAADPERLSSILAELDLHDWAGELVGTLSSGQRARLGMFPLCLSVQPVWLLDEPLNALDSSSIRILSKLVMNHLRAGGRAIMVSHLGVSAFAAMNPEVQLDTWILASGRLVPDQSGSAPPSSEVGPDATLKQPTVGQEKSHSLFTTPDSTLHSASRSSIARKGAAASLFGAGHMSLNLYREWLLSKASPQHLLWAGLFNLMVISFFGLSLNKPDPLTSLAIIWVSVLLSVMLPAKDWFQEDLRSGWLELAQGCCPGYLGSYWLAKVIGTWASASLVSIPVVLLGGLFLAVPFETVLWTALAVLTGLLAIMPLLGLVSLMVVLTRSGVILVYILGLPLIVPALLFGIEASRAVALGREPGAVLVVLVLAGGLGLLVGPKVSVRLMQVIQE